MCALLVGCAPAPLSPVSVFGFAAASPGSDGSWTAEFATPECAAWAADAPSPVAAAAAPLPPYAPAGASYWALPSPQVRGAQVACLNSYAFNRRSCM